MIGAEMCIRDRIKTTDLINPHFYKMWHTQCPYVLMKGGRGSFKSSVISLKLATEMKKHTQAKHKVNVVCMMSQQMCIRDRDTSDFTISMTWNREYAYPFDSWNMAREHASELGGAVEKV